MPFVRVSRDKRGYEQICLYHVGGGRRGKPARPQLLYVFRTPPGIKVGREPFDAVVRQSLETRNPGVLFDWKKLSNIPVPAPDVEYWRERRRALKAAKQARRAEELSETDALGALESAVPPEDEREGPAAPEGVVADVDEGVEPDEVDETAGSGPLAGPALPPPGTGGGEGATAGRRRRRRRGGRRRRHGAGTDAGSASQPSPPGAAEPGPAPEPSRLADDTPKEA